jgi:hypothetical protein
LSRETRFAIIGLALLAIAAAVAMVVFASLACPGDSPGQPCPAAGINRLVVIGLASVTASLAAAPFAFLSEFVLRRRIVYRGAWSRAARRGVLLGVVIAVLAGLRLGGALTVPVLIFVLLLAAAAEWFAIRRFDPP